MSYEVPTKYRIICQIKADLLRQMAASEKTLQDIRNSLHSGDQRARNRGERGVIQEKAWLLSGVAKRVHTLNRLMERFDLDQEASSDVVESGSLVVVEPEKTNNRRLEIYYIHPDFGGMSLSVDGMKVTVISPHAPVGEALLGHSRGDVLQVQLPDSTNQLKVIEVN